MLDILGEGGMGVVYKARQTSIDRSIALKMIKGEAASNRENHTKFLAEASVTGLLEHPNIVPIYDLGDDGAGSLFYSMKHVKGQPWSDIIKEKSLAENLAILDDTANAMAFAHDHGIIHRDLKPENVMLGGYGEVLVMDWGLAAAWRKDAKADTLPVKAPICGTPAYMSPEMAFGDGRLIGPVSDVYLLGAILFEILTGAPPHTGKTVMDCLRSCGTNSIRETEVKGELMDIALHAMKTDPGQRYQNVGELQKAIKTYQEHYDSIQLAQRASKDASEAREKDEYKLFAKSAFGFQEALNLWEGNEDARNGFNQVSLQYADCALQKGDLDLAESQLVEGLTPHEELREKIQRERRIRESSARRMKILKGAVALLVVAGIIGAIAAFAKISQEKEIAVKNEKEAIENARKAVEANRQRERAQAREGKLKSNEWWAFDADEAKRRQQEAAELLEWEPELEIKVGEDAVLSMVLIPAIPDRDNPRNNFVMGSHPDMEKGREGNESLHEVAFKRSWYMSRYELTRDVWRVVAGDAWLAHEEKRAKLSREPVRLVKIPGPVGVRLSPRLPVSDVSWNEVKAILLPPLQRFAPKGFRFDLPTEAEWEYACRAGTFTTYHYGMDEALLDDHAWYNSNSEGRVRVVGKKMPNAWGLYDVHGNIAELCKDVYDKEYYLKIPDLQTAWTDPLCTEGTQQRVVRGGSFFFIARHCRTAYRASLHEDHRNPNVGIRLVLRKAE
ncbi:MAG: bifunctional serine/threonine-protein kinase/formylglycine-generating enzyme family protein [Planctomycetota bacterium]|jgi:serine/threonine protein kinase/formylglycine-generating enzyme required for sulfatase activity